jgi:hypothetical protein
MPTYTDAEAVAAYLALSDAALALPEDEALADALIERAEDDVDRILDPALVRDDETGRKLDPDNLTDAQAAALSRAVAAQVEYRLTVGEDELVGDDSLRGVAGLTFQPATRPPGPKAVEELSAYGFPWRSGTVLPEPDPEDAL